mmetsp:Transcript_23177/g.33856  ORF Transcript_23177/g.33856 Transcript_23177/m.33856 type:complete len:306 (-) Transcript_23177:306-1223(-)
MASTAAASMSLLPDECIYSQVGGKQFAEFSCLYKYLEPFYMKFEKGYDPVPGLLWFDEHPYVPIMACALYGFLIVFGKMYMKDKEPWQWRKPLAMWNFSLSLFSCIGMIRTLPHLLHDLSTLSIRDNLCQDPSVGYGTGSTGLWVQLFILSKVPELLDTFFIVIHKKPLIFLHWYHHITVLLYCWHSYTSRCPYGIFFVTMNYSVHAIMYGYYFLMAINAKPKWLNAMFITAAQISQMIVGVIITLFAAYFYMTENDESNLCWINKENVIAAFVMYGSYLFLFAQFFVKRYFMSKNKLATKKKTA